MELFGDIATAIMTPLYHAMSGLLLMWHKVASLDPAQDNGWTWAIAIIATTLTVRAFGIPLSLKRMKAERAMLALQPRIQGLQKEFGDDRERLTQEQMKLWKETGVNPFSSCLPLLIALPIFFAVLRVIELPLRLGAEGARGFMSGSDATSLFGGELLGTTLADTLMDSEHGSTKILALVLIIVTALAQFAAQHRTVTHAPPGAMGGSYGQQQRVLLYVLPVVFAIGGFAFPLGVVLFWTTWYLWTWGEHAYLLKRGTPPDPPPHIPKQPPTR